MLIRIAFLPLGLALLGFNALTCQGAVLFSSAGGKEIENIKVSDEAKATIGDRNYALKLVGAGLRYKKVAFIKAKVYVGEFFVDAPEKIHRDSSKALSSLENIKAAAIRMTFLRDVDGEKISSGFKDALEANQVNMGAPAIKGFLDAVKMGGEAKEKKTLVILSEKVAGGKEILTYENSAGKAITVSGDAGLMRDIFSIWLGKAEDSGLENLKQEILGK